MRMTLSDDEIKSEFGFLKKVNFWMMEIGIACGAVLHVYYAGIPWWVALAEFGSASAAIFVPIQQFARVSDKKVEVAKIESKAVVETAAATVKVATIEANANEVPHE